MVEPQNTCMLCSQFMNPLDPLDHLAKVSYLFQELEEKLQDRQLLISMHPACNPEIQTLETKH